jgi:hypothetical protein
MHPAAETGTMHCKKILRKRKKITQLAVSRLRVLYSFCVGEFEYFFDRSTENEYSVIQDKLKLGITTIGHTQTYSNSVYNSLLVYFSMQSLLNTSYLFFTVWLEE